MNAVMRTGCKEGTVRGPIGGNTPAGKVLSCDLRGRLPKVALLLKSETKAGYSGGRPHGYTRHIEAKDAPCAAPAVARPAGPLAGALGLRAGSPRVSIHSPGASGSAARGDTFARRRS